MTPLPATITPTLGKLIPRLASDHPGEVVATVAAIGRVLEANKLDWHDLAAAVAPTVEDDWHDTLAFCAMHADRLDDKEQDFLKTLARWRGKPSAARLAGGYRRQIAEPVRNARSCLWDGYRGGQVPC